MSPESETLPGKHSLLLTCNYGGPGELTGRATNRRILWHRRRWQGVLGRILSNQVRRILDWWILGCDGVVLLLIVDFRDDIIFVTETIFFSILCSRIRKQRLVRKIISSKHIYTALHSLATPTIRLYCNSIQIS